WHPRWSPSTTSAAPRTSTTCYAGTVPASASPRCTGRCRPSRTPARSTCCAPRKARRSTGGAAPRTTTTWCVAAAGGQWRSRVPPSNVGRTRSLPSTGSPTSVTRWRSSAPARAAP
ncbi:MAG: Zinc uptake regulation protein Zur, partial [uncultured Nocardioidaceae bacterium]